MTEAYIVGGVRTPIGRYGGALASVRPDDLAAHAIREALARHPGIPADQIDEVVLGCANQAGEDNRNVARMAALLAGLPASVSGTTINRLCGSGLDAVGYAARAIKLGEADIIVAGGVESMSRAPFVMPKAASAFQRSAEIFDTTIGWRFVNPLMERQYGIDSMPETAENVAAEFSISREDQDHFALRSQARAAAAQKSGRFAREIAPVTIKGRKGEATVVEHDEHPRETTIEKLAGLSAPFRDGGTVTAGNASGVNDGAAAVIIASARAVERYGLKPLAKVDGMATAGVAPRIMGIGPVASTKKLGARGPCHHRHRYCRAQRSLCRAVAGMHASTWPRRRCGPRQSEWRRDRPRPPARHVGCTSCADSGVGTRPARRKTRARHHVHRRRPGYFAADQPTVASCSSLRRFGVVTPQPAAAVGAGSPSPLPPGRQGCHR